MESVEGRSSQILDFEGETPRLAERLHVDVRGWRETKDDTEDILGGTFGWSGMLDEEMGHRWFGEHRFPEAEH